MYSERLFLFRAMLNNKYGDIFMRRKIYEIVEKANDNNNVSHLYDVFMIISIFLSMIPLAFKQQTKLLIIIDRVTVIIFIIDYILRWTTSDYKFKKEGITPFLQYPFSPMAIVDLLSILPSVSVVSKSFKVLRVLRLIRALRVFRIFKAIRYSKSFKIIGNVLVSSKDSLFAVCALASGYILVSALTIFNAEPESFETFFDAVYWATVSLTTVGYGDIYPVSTIGRIIAMISSIFGIAIVALPAGIITAGYMNELQKDRD